MNLQTQHVKAAFSALAEIGLINATNINAFVVAYIRWYCLEELGLSEDEAIDWAASAHLELASEALKNFFKGGAA